MPLDIYFFLYRHIELPFQIILDHHHYHIFELFGVVAQV